MGETGAPAPAGPPRTPGSTWPRPIPGIIIVVNAVEMHSEIENVLFIQISSHRETAVRAGLASEPLLCNSLFVAYENDNIVSGKVSNESTIKTRVNVT